MAVYSYIFSVSIEVFVGVAGIECTVVVSVGVFNFSGTLSNEAVNFQSGFFSWIFWCALLMKLAKRPRSVCLERRSRRSGHHDYLGQMG